MTVDRFHKMWEVCLSFSPLQWYPEPRPFAQKNRWFAIFCHTNLEVVCLFKPEPERRWAEASSSKA